jgi:CheY-like chemotaxis protein
MPTAALQPIRLRVLLVDDDVRTTRRFASMLEEDGFTVEVLRDGVEAMERIDRDPRPDAIVTDVIMPRAGGLAVLGAARRRWKDVPVIFVTGHPELLANPGIPFDHAPTVFTKPISYADFSETLQRLVHPGAEDLAAVAGRSRPA